MNTDPVIRIIPCAPRAAAAPIAAGAKAVAGGSQVGVLITAKAAGTKHARSGATVPA